MRFTEIIVEDVSNFTSVGIPVEKPYFDPVAEYLLPYAEKEKAKVAKKRKEVSEEDKMGMIDIDSSIKSTQQEWRDWISTLPKTLAQEFIDERPNPDQSDIDEYTSLRLTSNMPISINTKKLINLPWVQGAVSRTPKDVVNSINQRWGSQFKPGKVYDQNPDRYFKYAKMPAETAKPSVMVNGEIIFGVGRLIAALLRGDQQIKVWNLKSVKSEEAAGVGIVTKQNATRDVPVGGEYMNVGKLFPKNQKKKRKEK